MFEVVADTEEAACHPAQVLGFIAVAVLLHGLDAWGKPRDLSSMES
jgi:hypothetical protein